MVGLGENLELCRHAHCCGNVLSCSHSHFVNCFACSIAWLLELIICVQPPYTVTGLPPAGIGSGAIPYSTFGKPAFSCAIAQKPHTCIAASPRPSGPMSAVIVAGFFCVKAPRTSLPQRSNADAACGVRRADLVEPASTTSPPALHRNGYQVKFWYGPGAVSMTRPFCLPPVSSCAAASSSSHVLGGWTPALASLSLR